MKPLIIDLNTDELEALVISKGFPAYRGRQIAEWLYRHGAGSFDDMKNLPVSLRTHLTEQYDVPSGSLVTIQHGNDGTAKLLLELRDGARIESVALPYQDRFSCCISTQAGCPIGCVFCASGKDGFVRNLLPGEIVGQVLAIQTLIQSGKIKTTEKNRRIDHIVFMGMGEPLLNYQATLKALNLFTRGMGIATRNLTVSTVGIVPEIRRLAMEQLQITLAVSLHAPNDKLRKRLVPGVSRWTIADIVEACREYFRATGRRITFEYCLLDSINDSPDEARELAEVLFGLNCHVNLIRFNDVPGLGYRPSSVENTGIFRGILEKTGIQVTQRFQRGAGISAACGQLRQDMKRR